MKPSDIPSKMHRGYLRWQVFERDSYTCVLCSRAAVDVHHVVPRSQGGSNLPDNLVSVCRLHHILLHGQHVIGLDEDTADAKYRALEYVCDYYADKWRGYSHLD